MSSVQTTRPAASLTNRIFYGKIFYSPLFTNKSQKIVRFYNEVLIFYEFKIMLTNNRNKLHNSNNNLAYIFVKYALILGYKNERNVRECG